MKLSGRLFDALRDLYWRWRWRPIDYDRPPPPPVPAWRLLLLSAAIVAGVAIFLLAAWLLSGRGSPS